MKRFVFGFSILLIATVGSATARAGGGYHGGGGGWHGGGGYHGGYGGGYHGGYGWHGGGYCGYGNGWYGGGCWPSFTFGIGFGGYYPGYYGGAYYGYPAYSYYPGYSYSYAPVTYARPTYVYTAAQPYRASVAVNVAASRSPQSAATTAVYASSKPSVPTAVRPVSAKEPVVVRNTATVASTPRGTWVQDPNPYRYSPAEGSPSTAYAVNR